MARRCAMRAPPLTTSSAGRCTDVFEGPFAASPSPPRNGGSITGGRCVPHRNPTGVDRLLPASAVGTDDRERQTMPELRRDWTIAFEAQMQHADRAESAVQRSLVRKIGRHTWPDEALENLRLTVAFQWPSLARVYLDASQLECHRAEVREMQLVEQMRCAGAAIGADGTAITIGSAESGDCARLDSAASVTMQRTVGQSRFIPQNERRRPTRAERGSAGCVCTSSIPSSLSP
jgi:hypothetical protein